MKQKWRLLRDDIREPGLHFAVEEAILQCLESSISPCTLRLRKVIPCVFIGVYQYADEDVDIDYCRKMNIPVIRRPNPGGAVYQDEGSFCYSAFFRKGEFFKHIGINDSSELFGFFGSTVLALLDSYGIRGDISPVNDITVGGRKIYGSAQVELFDCFVHSGTFLVNCCKENMEKALKPSMLKFEDKGFKNVRDRVVNLAELLMTGTEIDVNDVMSRLAGVFESRAEIKLYNGELSAKEIALAKKFYEEKYSQHEWTFNNRPSYDTFVSAKAESGVISLFISVKDNIIHDLKISGDFLVPDQVLLKEALDSVKGHYPESGVKIIQNSKLPSDVKLTISKLMREIQ